MKRLLLLAVGLAVGAATAQAQTGRIIATPHYAESYEEETGKLKSKEWVSGQNLRQELTRDDGTSQVVIYRADSAKVYMLNAERKTYIAVSMQQATEGKLWGIETMETANRSTTREFVRNETIDGWECTLWSVTGKSVSRGGDEEGWTREEWRHEPTKIVIRGTDPNRGRGYLIRRNIVVGAQPESMFVIPRDYAAMNVPMGGLMEMITGRTEGQVRESDEAKNAQSQMEQLKDLGNDASKSNEQKAADIFKMLEGLKKK